MRCIRGRVLFEGAVYLTRTEFDEGRSQEAMDNFFAQSHYTDFITNKFILFSTLCQIHLLRKMFKHMHHIHW